MKKMKPWRVLIAVVFVFVFTFGTLIASILYTNHTVHQLCDVINISANSPVPKDNSPLATRARIIHKDFVNLQREYNC